MPPTPPSTPARDEARIRDRGDACPGALRLHAADDGGLARLRLPAGRLTAHQVEALAVAAETLGDGRISLTSGGTRSCAASRRSAGRSSPRCSRRRACCPPPPTSASATSWPPRPPTSTDSAAPRSSCGPTSWTPCSAPNPGRRRFPAVSSSSSTTGAPTWRAWAAM
ncbi:hypothetical protein [Streptomyces narbonensis]